MTGVDAHELSGVEAINFRVQTSQSESNRSTADVRLRGSLSHFGVLKFRAIGNFNKGRDRFLTLSESREDITPHNDNGK